MHGGGGRGGGVKVAYDMNAVLAAAIIATTLTAIGNAHSLSKSVIALRQGFFFVFLRALTFDTMVYICLL